MVDGDNNADVATPLKDDTISNGNGSSETIINRGYGTALKDDPKTISGIHLTILSLYVSDGKDSARTVLGIPMSNLDKDGTYSENVDDILSGPTHTVGGIPRTISDGDGTDVLVHSITSDRNVITKLGGGVLNVEKK